MNSLLKESDHNSIIEPKLDKQLDMLLKFNKKLSKPNIYDLPVEEARNFANQSIESLILKSEEVGFISEIHIPFPDTTITIRVYSPIQNEPTILPVIIFLHGGGFVLYDVSSFDSLCRYLCNHTNCRVIFVEYRKSPEHPFPAAYEDAFNILDWVYKNHEDLNIDPEKIILMGDSVGGSLTLNTSVKASENKIPIILQILIYPMINFDFSKDSYNRYGTGFFLDTKTMEWFLGKTCNNDVLTINDPRLNSMLLDRESILNMPPTLLFSSEFDILKDDSFRFNEKYLSLIKHMIHIHFHHLCHNFLLMSGYSKEAKLATDQIITHINKFLNN